MTSNILLDTAYNDEMVFHIVNQLDAVFKCHDSITKQRTEHIKTNSIEILFKFRVKNRIWDNPRSIEVKSCLNKQF